MFSKTTNRIDEIANRLQQENNTDQVESEILKFNPRLLRGDEKESWYHTYGITAFHRDDREAAFERFQEGLKQCPKSADIAFSLGQEYEYRGDVDTMLSLFDRARFPNICADYALEQSRLAYLWNRYDKALFYLDPIIKAYFKLKILDDMFLYMRGLPFFGTTWSYFVSFHKLMGNRGGIEEFLGKVEKKCRDYNFDYLHASVDLIISVNYEPMIKWLTSIIEHSRENDLSVGYHILNLKIIESQNTADLDKAEKLLMEANLDEKWLEDMRLLARCELANRKQNKDEEKLLRNEFLNIQPLLFRPDNAFDFNLLDYQETMKQEYQEKRKTYKSLLKFDSNVL